MKKLAAQQVQREKEEGEKRLEEALVKAREEFLLEKSEAVQKAREEERVIAADEAKKVAQAEEEKRKQLILAAEKEKQVPVSDVEWKNRFKELQFVIYPSALKNTTPPSKQKNPTSDAKILATPSPPVK